MSQRFKVIEHMPLMIDDFIRNVEREEAIKKKSMLNKVAIEYECKLRRSKINEEILEAIDDPVAKGNKLISHELEILDNVVPLYVFRERIKHPRETTPIALLSLESTIEFFNIEEDVSPVGFGLDHDIDLATGDLYEMKINNVRILEYEEFVSDQEFVNTLEFQTFLYKYKGRMIR